MKHIIILGEEYWFKKTNYEEATYLLEELNKYNNKKYIYTILQSPAQLIDSIKTIDIKNIKALFLFHDVITNSNLNKKTILEMINFLKELYKNNIYIYPQVDIIDNFGGKKYYNTLVNKLRFASLPHSRVLIFSKYVPFKDEKIIKTKLWKNINDMWKISDNIVLKKGYSYESKQVITLNKNNIKDFYNFADKIRKLNLRHLFGSFSNSIYMDNGIDRYYILQPYNKIVVNRNNEYRVFFIDGEIKYISKGLRIPNTCILDEIKKPLEYEIIKFAKKLYKKYIPLIWNEKQNPILFRIDVSYAVDDIFQDKYSVNIKGFDKPIRIYCNELEIDPTSYFYNSFLCNTDNNFNTKKLQIYMAKTINKFIDNL